MQTYTHTHSQVAPTLEAQSHSSTDNTAAVSHARWGFYPFYMPILDAQGQPLSNNSTAAADAPAVQAFELSAPTTARNAFRLLRALQVCLVTCFG